ncbi:MAG: hypothetical protein JO337_07545, partial [Acidimicrobiales bacterium]|nr:hypothetical protein [Acidimicrobiales bacterium]
LGLVTTRREGNFIFYSCDHPQVRALVREALSYAQRTRRTRQKKDKQAKQ